MFQYGRRGILLAISFYKNFLISKEGQNGVDFEEVGISQQQKGVLFQFYQFSLFSKTLRWYYFHEDCFCSFCV